MHSCLVISTLTAVNMISRTLTGREVISTRTEYIAMTTVDVLQVIFTTVCVLVGLVKYKIHR